uniref:Minor structural protein n=1 Tax=Siphoviridae sp. ctxjx4 TaxID=2826522 RepID=A0A8S5M2D3_9CAUD|nr:MAG TPA: minor structural protein [Siphoviridae sp. ctxjx4]
MNKYEISVWEDYFVPASGSIESHYEERKLCIIGSNTMDDGSRALEPNLVLNVNGTHTLSFKMYLFYIDTLTGERVDNPYVKLLVNERKIKVYWDNGQEDENDKWFDLVVKDISEDSDSNTVTYTCEDLFINELGKSGFELNFSDEANNNQGTIYELATAILGGTDWQLDEKNTDHLLQTQEEALYEVTITNMNALTGVYANGFLNITKDKYEKIPNNATCYLPYSMVPHSNEEFADMTAVQFIYAPEYTTEYSSMLITNEDSNWLVTGGAWVKAGDVYQFKIPSSGTTKTIFTINLSNAFVSDQYRGNVYCRKQLSTYDANLERYVNVYKLKGTTPTADDKRIFGYVDYDYDASDLVNNLLANNRDFKNTNGWIGKKLKIDFLPELGLDTDLTTYKGHSYLSAAIKAGQNLINDTLSSAAQYLSSGLFKGMEVKFKIGLKDKFTAGTLSAAIVDKETNSTIYLGKLDNKKNSIFTNLTQESIDSDGTVWYSGTLTCLKALAKNFLEDAELVIKSTNPTETIIKILETRLYEIIHGKDNNGNDKTLDLYDINSSDVAKKYYYYYYEGTSNPDGTAPYIYKAQIPCPLYEPIYGGWAKSAGATDREYSQFEKVRTIYGEQSNRFNLLQELAETFKCWARFKIYHNADGSVARDEKGKPKKYVYYSEKIGQQLPYGFTYGIDLNTIRRTQSSSELVTKTIVLANYNDNAPNGTCSIVDSEENYPRENFVLNFDYYINHGLLDGEALNRDLYYSGSSDNYIGYYTKLHKWNIEYLAAADRAILLRNQEVRLLQQSVVYDGLLACAVKERDELIDELAALGGDTLDPTKTDPKADNSDKSNEIITAKWIPIKKALQQMKQIISYKTDGNNNVTSKVEGPSDQNADLIKTIKDLDGDIASYKVICAKLDAALAALQSTIEANTANRDRLLKLIKELHQKFYNKYSNYIQEGSWTSEDYIDPNIYYYDALSVAYTSSRPQVQYDIAVTRVSELPEFKFRRFHVGDTTYVQDTDFFGYEPYLKNDKVRTPYKEAVLISEISINFEEPDKDTITVQNYKTQFEDLFQRINATTQSLQYAQGGYNRAAGVVNGKGELKEDILQDSLLAAQDIVTKATDESVVQDNTGITLTSLKNLDQKLKITSGGIVFSDDGGETWTTMIKAGQIGVQFLSAGSISTSKITIMDGTTPAFRWDTNGISAYWSGKDYLTPESNPVLKMNRFVRFDKFGIYGYNNGNDEDNTNFVPASEEEVRSNSMFSLTWSGLLIRSIEKDGSNKDIGSIEINNKYDIVVSKYVTKNNVTEAVPKVQIGRLNNNGNYGIRICDNGGNPVLETVDNGSLWLRQSLSIGTETNTNVKIGVLDNDQVFNANNNFIVNKDGTAKMTGVLRIKGKYKDLLLKSFQETQQYDDFCGIFLVPTTDSTGSQYEGIMGFSFDSNGTAGGVVQSPGVLSISGNQSLEVTGAYSMKAYSTIKAGQDGVGTMIGCGMPQPYQDGYSVSLFNSYDGMRFVGNKYGLKLSSYKLNDSRYPARLALRNTECTASLEVVRKTTLGTYTQQVPTAEFCLFNTLSGEIAEQTPFSSADVRVRISSHPTASNHIIINFYERAKWLGTLHISNTEFVYDAAGQ